jgi:hypothetical protein
MRWLLRLCPVNKCERAGRGIEIDIINGAAAAAMLREDHLMGHVGIIRRVDKEYGGCRRLQCRAAVRTPVLPNVTAALRRGRRRALPPPIWSCANRAPGMVACSHVFHDEPTGSAGEAGRLALVPRGHHPQAPVRRGQQPFNPDNEPLVLESLENATGMDRATVESMCRALEQQGLVELHPDGGTAEAARLTQLGHTRVWERLASHRAVAG